MDIAWSDPTTGNQTNSDNCDIAWRRQRYRREKRDGGGSRQQGDMHEQEEEERNSGGERRGRGESEQSEGAEEAGHDGEGRGGRTLKEFEERERMTNTRESRRCDFIYFFI